MASWQEVATEAPELASVARRLLDAHRHKTLATLRHDGAPRTSGIEAAIVGDQLWMGMMPASMKALDLRRDPRLSLHSASDDPGDDPASWPGDARVAGRAVAVTDPIAAQDYLEATGAGTLDDFALFRVDVAELVVNRLNAAADRMVIEWWREGVGLQRAERT
jgi:Pyridoxamine 5'-phosphate oxidase